MTRVGRVLIAGVAIAVLAAGCGDGVQRGTGTAPAQPVKCLSVDPSIELAARAHVRDVTIGKETRFDAERLGVQTCRISDAEASATVTIYGLRDVSIRDVRHTLTLVPEAGFWNVMKDVETRRCQIGLGQQTFGTAKCQ